MNPTLLVINGPSGVGKTTAAKLIANAYTASAHVRGDDLKRFVISKPIDTEAARVSYRNGARVCSELIDSGFEFVVFDFVFPTGSHADAFFDALNSESEFDVYFVTLWASENALKHRRSHRESGAHTTALVRETQEKMSRYLARLGTVIDTSDLDPEAVHAKLRKQISLRRTFGLADVPISNRR